MDDLQNAIINNTINNLTDLLAILQYCNVYNNITTCFDYQDQTLVCLIEDAGVNTIDLAIIYHCPYYNLIIPPDIIGSTERIARYFWIAVIYDNYLALDWLLAHITIDINSNMLIYPLLHLAIINNRITCITILYNYKCDMNVVSRLGNCHDVARYYGNTHLIPLLKQYGSKDHEDQFIICQTPNPSRFFPSVTFW